MEVFTDKVVAILGAASAIGTATAILYSQRQAILILCDSDENDLNDVAAQCHAAGYKNDQLSLIVGEITSAEIQEKIVKTAEDNFKRLDILINAADTKIPGSPVPGIDPDDFKTTLDRNLQAVANMCFAAIPSLRKTKGNIVNVSSAMGEKPSKNHVSYCVSKAGLDMLTKCLALDMAPHGVRVNSVNPGHIAAVTDVPDPDAAEFVKFTTEKTPLGRLAKAEEVADAIIFLSSTRANSTTGQLFRVDGGAGL